MNYLNQKQNGRIIEISNKNYKNFNLFEEKKNKNNNFFKENALNGIQEKSQLSSLFFSKENINNIQNLIRYTVYRESNNEYVIGNQSTIDLEIIMRSVYLQHSINLNCKFKEQIKYLNNIVLNNTVPNILNEIKQYLGYIDNVEKLPVPLELPQNLSSAGTKTLQSITKTF